MVMSQKLRSFHVHTRRYTESKVLEILREMQGGGIETETSKNPGSFKDYSFSKMVDRK